MVQHFQLMLSGTKYFVRYIFWYMVWVGGYEWMCVSADQLSSWTLTSFTEEEAWTHGREIWAPDTGNKYWVRGGLCVCVCVCVRETKTWLHSTNTPHTILVYSISKCERVHVRRSAQAYQKRHTRSTTSDDLQHNRKHYTRPHPTHRRYCTLVHPQYSSMINTGYFTLCEIGSYPHKYWIHSGY